MLEKKLLIWHFIWSVSEVLISGKITWNNNLLSAFFSDQNTKGKVFLLFFSSLINVADHCANDFCDTVQYTRSRNNVPIRHTTLNQRRFNIDYKSKRWINVKSTLFQRCVPPEWGLKLVLHDRNLALNSDLAQNYKYVWSAQCSLHHQ